MSEVLTVPSPSISASGSALPHAAIKASRSLVPTRRSPSMSAGQNEPSGVTES